MADGRRGGKGPRGDYEVAAPIGNYEKGERQFHKIDPKSRDRILAQRKDLSDFGKERRLREAKPGVGRGKPGEGESKTVQGKRLPLPHPGEEVGGDVQGGGPAKASADPGGERRKNRGPGGIGGSRKAVGSKAGEGEHWPE